MASDVPDGLVRVGLFEWRRAVLGRDLVPSGTLMFGWFVAAYGDTGDGSNIRPSQKTIMADSGISKDDTVRKHLRALEGAGLLVKVAEGNPGRGLAAEYALTVPAGLLALPPKKVGYEERGAAPDPRGEHPHKLAPDTPMNGGTTSPRPPQDLPAAREEPARLAVTSTLRSSPWSDREWETAIQVGINAVEGWTRADATAAVTAIAESGQVRTSLVGYVRNFEPRRWRSWHANAPAPERSPAAQEPRAAVVRATAEGIARARQLYEESRRGRAS